MAGLRREQFPQQSLCVIVVLSGLLAFSMVFNIAEIIRCHSKETINLPTVKINHTCNIPTGNNATETEEQTFAASLEFHFTISSPDNNPNNYTLSCFNCPSWVEEYLRIGHALAFQNTSQSWTLSNNSWTTPTTGRVELYRGIGLLRKSFMIQEFDHDGNDTKSEFSRQLRCTARINQTHESFMTDLMGVNQTVTISSCYRGMKNRARNSYKLWKGFMTLSSFEEREALLNGNDVNTWIEQELLLEMGADIEALDASFKKWKDEREKLCNCLNVASNMERLGELHELPVENRCADKERFSPEFFTIMELCFDVCYDRV